MTFNKTFFISMIIVTIIFPEDIFDFLLTFIQYGYEGFEYLLEEIIQYVFHIDKFESQTYVFYIQVAIASGLALLIYRKAPKTLTKLKTNLDNYYFQQKKLVFGIWHNMDIVQKTLLLCVYIPIFLYICSFFVM